MVSGQEPHIYRHIILQQQCMRPVDHLHGFHADLVVIRRVLTRSGVESDLWPLTGASAFSEKRVGAQTLPVQPKRQAVKPHHVIGGAAHTHACQHMAGVLMQESETCGLLTVGKNSKGMQTIHCEQLKWEMGCT